MSEMTEGYLDGLDPNNPDPSANRSHAYRHGFANGRDDLARKPRDTLSNLWKAAEEAIKKDLSA